MYNNQSMQNRLRQTQLDGMTKLTPLLADGIAMEHCKRMVARIDETCHSMFRSLGPEFVFNRVQRCTPRETYEARTYQAYTGLPLSIDVGRTDSFTVKLQATFKGDPIRISPIHLPIVGQYGEFFINDTPYYALPVMAGIPFSVEENKVFIALQRHPMIMGKTNYDIVRNGTRFSADMVHTVIYNKDRNASVRNKLFNRDQYTTLQHILYAKYGVREAFKKLFNVDVKVVDTSNTIDYDSDTHYLFTTIGSRPNYADRVKLAEYRPTNYGILLPKEECTDEITSMIGGFFYVLDLFPDYFEDEEYLDSADVWKIAMGNILFNKEQSEGFVLKKMEAHIDSLDYYLDITKAKELMTHGIAVSDFYEFCARMLTYVPTLLRETSVTSVYGKKLTVLSYLLFNLVCTLNSISYEISKVRRDKGDLALTSKKVNSIFNLIKAHTVIKPLSGKDHPEVITTSLPNDLPPVKITNQVVPQAKAKGGTGGSTDATKDKSLLLDGSMAEVCSPMHVSKGEGTGRNKLNLMVLCKPDGTIQPRPEFQLMIQSFNKLIGRKVYPPCPEVELIGLPESTD